jgi:hypothetical protein
VLSTAASMSSWVTWRGCVPSPPCKPSTSSAPATTPASGARKGTERRYQRCRAGAAAGTCGGGEAVAVDRADPPRGGLTAAALPVAGTGPGAAVWGTVTWDEGPASGDGASRERRGRRELL